MHHNCTKPHRGHASRIFCCLLHFLLPLLLPVAVLTATFDVNCIFYGSLHFLMLALLPATFFIATFAATFTATSSANHIFYCHFYCHFYCQPHFLLPLLLPSCIASHIFCSHFYCHFYCQPHFLLPLLLSVVLPATFFTAARGRERKMVRETYDFTEIIPFHNLRGTLETNLIVINKLFLKLYLPPRYCHIEGSKCNHVWKCFVLYSVCLTCTNYSDHHVAGTKSGSKSGSRKCG